MIVTHPGSTIGIVGGGQLGRMLARAASRMGYRTHIFTPDKDSPASHVATVTTVGAYQDAMALRAFAQSVDVITFEFENVPAETLEMLDRVTAVRPKPSVLSTTRHRFREKEFIRAQGIATAPYARVHIAAVPEAESACQLAQSQAHWTRTSEKVLFNQHFTQPLADLKSAVSKGTYGFESRPAPGQRIRPPSARHSSRTARRGHSAPRHQLGRVHLLVRHAQQSFAVGAVVRREGDAHAG